MGEEDAAEVLEKPLEATSTWAVASVCFILISVSIFMEHLLHLLSKMKYILPGKTVLRQFKEEDYTDGFLDKYFSKKKRKSLLQALDKIKSDLMQLGFMSLLLTASEKGIANICISKSAGESFLPCSSVSSDHTEEEAKCAEQGKMSLLSREGVKELQYLIFSLAFSHSLSCILTFSLGMAKTRRWVSWEAQTRTLEYQFSNDSRRFKLAHQTSFGRQHLKFWSEHKLLRWPICFLQQFYRSVSKTDYFTLRHGFVTAHLAEGSNFDFQKYIRRALEKDFGVVMGTSFWIWIFCVLFIFFNANGFYNYLWLPFIPLVMLLVVGTKLQDIITEMCLDSHGKSHVVRGTLLVRPSDHFFWFGRPKLLLHLIHLILFQNSFQLAFFSWTWYKFGLRSCFHRKTEDIAIRLAIGVLVQILCGYVTLPLYALVTQMGTSMKKAAVFPESVVKGLKKWRAKARESLALSTSPYTARPSFDASLDQSLTSLGTSPSFSLDSSFPTEFDPSSMDTEHVVGDQIMREESEGRGNEQELQKDGVFDGFNVNS